MFLLLLTLLAVNVYPAQCLSPCDVRIRLTVEPSPDNERVVLELEAEDSAYYRSSDLFYQFKGAPKRVDITYPGIPAGTYMLTVTLHKHDGKSWIAARVMKTIRVVE